MPESDTIKTSDGAIRRGSDDAKPKLSSYGDPEKRLYHPWISLLASYSFVFLYLGPCLLPVLLPAFAFFGLYLQWMPVTALKVLATLIAMDYAIPLQNGYKPNKKLKVFLDRIFAEGGQLYFPAKSIFLPKLSKDRSYILAAWPHGLFGGGNHYGLCDFEEAGFYPIYSGASVMLYLPFVRRFVTMVGWTSVTKAGLSRVLDTKKYGPSYPFSIVHLVVGGIHEMFYTPGYAVNEQIIITKRKGFIKLALETGADIIPMYSFGANQTYYRIAGPNSWMCKVSTALRVSLTPWFGRFWIPFGFLPFCQPILTVSGDVFPVPKVATGAVTDELVQQVHADFSKALRQLFDTYKKVYVEEMGADQEWLTRELMFEGE